MFCECALTKAACHGQLAAGKLLLQHPKIDINVGVSIHDFLSVRPLTIKQLQHFPISCKDIRDWNRTALIAAVCQPREDFVRLLLDHSQQTGTPLHDMVSTSTSACCACPANY